MRRPSAASSTSMNGSIFCRWKCATPALHPSSAKGRPTLPDRSRLRRVRCAALRARSLRVRVVTMPQRVSQYARLPHVTYETPAWVTQIVAPYLRQHHCQCPWHPANEPGSKIAQTLRGESPLRGEGFFLRG